jgi:hypothetical protein
VFSRRTTCIAVASLCVALTSVIACEIRVRDSAFRMVRDLHKLCVIADSSDESADAIEERLNQWLDQSDGKLNLEIVRIDADDPETNWRSLGIPSAPPAMPVTVLVGRDNGIGESFIVDHWEPAPTIEDLAAIVDSPGREQLAAELAKHVAVLVFAPRDPTSESSVTSDLKSVIEAGIADERIGLSMITVDRSDPAERLLCRFMGLRPDAPNTLCVAFGRGKLMSPPLVGDEINAESIATLVTMIRQACSCSKPLATMGVDVPLVWSDAIDSTVVLMDDELELSELDTEVQNMLAAKATSVVTGDPTVIPIPMGQQSASQLPVAAAKNNRTATVAVGFGTLSVIALAVFLLRRRSSEQSDSAS